MLNNNKSQDTCVKDVIVSPKGGCLLLYESGKYQYIPSPDYTKNRVLFNLKKTKSYLEVHSKRKRDNKVLIKYIIPAMFRILNLKMPSFDSMKLNKCDEL